MFSEEIEKHPSGSTDLTIVLELLDVPTPDSGIPVCIPMTTRENGAEVIRPFDQG